VPHSKRGETRLSFRLDVHRSLSCENPSSSSALCSPHPRNEVLYATRAGELADARRMSESGIYDFLRKVTQTAKAKQ
jgi:hypothetical protein